MGLLARTTSGGSSMSPFATTLGTKVAIAALSLIVIGGGTAVAAANGASSTDPFVAEAADPTSTPSTDDTTTDVAEDPTETDTDTPAELPESAAAQGPDATGPAAFGLCTAFTAGGLNDTSVAYAALLKAAESAGTIEDYCEPILEGDDGEDPDPSSSLTPETETQTDTGPGQSGADHGNAPPHAH
jgi:hypothetical protein